MFLQVVLHVASLTACRKKGIYILASITFFVDQPFSIETYICTRCSICYNSMEFVSLRDKIACSVNKTFQFKFRQFGAMKNVADGLKNSEEIIMPS